MVWVMKLWLMKESGQSSNGIICEHKRQCMLMEVKTGRECPSSMKSLSY